MLNNHALKMLADELEKDILILPSSVHECILVPADDERYTLESLADMVRSVNNMYLKEKEILSYHVYRFERGTGEVTIAA